MGCGLAVPRVAMLGQIAKSRAGGASFPLLLSRFVLFCESFLYDKIWEIHNMQWNEVRYGFDSD